MNFQRRVIMFEADAKKLTSQIILDPYSVNDLRHLVNWARQDFLNSVCDYRTLQLKKQGDMEKGFPHWWIGTIRHGKSLKMVQRDIREKRVLLDNLERALEVAAYNDYENSERREFYFQALEEEESNDDTHYERKLDEIGQRIERMSEKDLLGEIRKQLAEVLFTLQKINHQKKRRQEWKSHGPPNRIREEFKKLYANNQKRDLGGRDRTEVRD
jgi:hypothetical protein